MENKQVLFSIKPKFNFIYEMFMPTGRKLRNTLIILVFVVLSYFFIGIGLNSREFSADITESVDIVKIFNYIALIMIAIFVIKFVIHLVIQVWQYSSIKYTFYDDYLEYEDTFLHQSKKTLRYDNIKEIEIKRSVWDRMNGYGIIVIYSNAEKSNSKGLIIYSVKDSKRVYNKIDDIVHRKKDINIGQVSKENINTSSEKDFKNSLNNLKGGE